MPETRYSPAAVLDVEYWTGTPASLKALSVFADQNVTVSQDGSVTVLLDGGEVEALQRGWCLYRGADGLLGAMSAARAAKLEDLPAA